MSLIETIIQGITNKMNHIQIKIHVRIDQSTQLRILFQVNHFQKFLIFAFIQFIRSNE